MFDTRQMRSLRIRLIVFAVLWYEIAAYFKLGVDAAALLTLLLVFGVAFVNQFALDVAGLTQPLTTALITRGVIWLAIYLFLCPPVLAHVPYSFLGVGVVALAFLGARLRRDVDTRGLVITPALLQAHSRTLVSGSVALLAFALAVKVKTGSVLPLAAGLAMVGLPVWFGWDAAGPRVEVRADAAFGDRDMFRDEGVSDEF